MQSVICGGVHRPQSIPVLILLVVACALGLTTGGCEESAPRTRRGKTGYSMRIVTLAPALTQMVVDLGGGDQLVGVSENDNAAPKGLPTVGNYLNIDSEMLVTAKPTHVLMMYGKEGVPQHMKNLARSEGFNLIAYSYPNNILELTKIISNELNPPSVAYVLDRVEQARRLNIPRRLDRIREMVQGRPRPRVLLLINTDPLMASGSNTVLYDVLNFYLNANNVVADAENSAPVLDREMLIKANPQVILLLRPNAPPLGTIDEDPRLASFRGLGISAVRENRIVLIDDPLVLLPSTALVRVAAAMAAAIYPDLAGQFEPTLAVTDPLEIESVDDPQSRTNRSE